MKKILTLLLAAAAFISVHAQSREDARRVILGNRNENYGSRDVILGQNNNGNYSYGNDRQYQIEHINRECDVNIQSIRNNRYLSNHEKDKQIRRLQKDREKRIKEMNKYFDKHRNDNDGRYNRPHDNGKHKGWYK